MVTHELTHVVQSLLIGEDNPGLADVWLTEGLAEVMSGGTAGGRITDLNRLNELRQQYGWSLNPIKMHRYDYPAVEGIIYYYYYPMFQLAVEYLVDANGHGKTMRVATTQIILKTISLSISSQTSKPVFLIKDHTCDRSLT